MACREQAEEKQRRKAPVEYVQRMDWGGRRWIERGWREAGVYLMCCLPSASLATRGNN